MARLKGKVAVVTGGAKGIGECIARTLAKEGAQVIACDMSPLSYECKNVEGYILNVTDTDGVQKFFDDIIARYERIDILVNNAGITRDGLTRKMTDDMWNLVIDVNLKGVFNMTRLIGPKMQENNYGSIINIASVVGEYGNIGQANYAATKSALYGLTKTWAKEFARKGENVRVNALSPGYVLTDILKTVPQDLLDKFAGQTMLGRLGQPQEIANVVLFLASDEASYVTGTNLSANGGMRL